jgi:hypothetical protein
MEPLLPFFKWCDGSWLGETIRNSQTLFPIIETFHLFALTILLGTTIIVSLRLFGVMFRSQTVPDLAREIRPWNRWSLGVMLVTGSLLFTSEALKCYGNTSFQAKMLFLFAALAFHFTIFRKVTSGEWRTSVLWNKFTATASLALWFSVGLAGRGIGFLG